LGHGGRGLLAPAHSAALTLLLLPRGNGPSAAGLQGGRDLLWVQTPPKEEHPETCNMQARCESGLPRLSWRRGGDRTTGATAMGQQGHNRRQNWWRAARDGEEMLVRGSVQCLSCCREPPSLSQSFSLSARVCGWQSALLRTSPKPQDRRNTTTNIPYPTQDTSSTAELALE